MNTAAVGVLAALLLLGIDAGGAELRRSEADAPAELPAEARSLIAEAKAAAGKGEYDEAIELYSRASHVAEKELGPDSPLLIEPWASLGLLLQQRGQLSEAEALLQRALANAARHPGTSTRAIAAAHDAAAFKAIEKGNLNLAAAALASALALRRAAQPQDLPDIARNLFRLASTRRQQSDLGQARELFEEALALSEQTSGRHHTLHASILNEYALVFYDLGDYGRAEQLLDEALATRESLLGPGNVAVAYVLLRLGAVYDEQQRYVEAERAYRRALKIRVEELGSENPMLATVYSNVGESLLLQGRHADAIEPLLAARKLRLAHMADNMQRIGTGAHLLADAYRGLGDTAKATDFFSEAVTMLAAAESPEYLSRALASYSGFLAAHGDRDAAILHGKRAVNLVQWMRHRARTLEPTLRQSLVRKREAMYRHLAGLLIDAGRLIEAQEVIDALKEEEYREFVRGAYRGGKDDDRPIGYTTREAPWGERLSTAPLTPDAREKYVALLRSIEEEMNPRVAGADATGQRETMPSAARGERAATGAPGSVASIRKGESRIYTLVEPGRLRLVVTTQRGTVHRDVAVSAAQLARAVFDLRSAVRDTRSDPRTVAQRLYQLTLGPVDDLLRDSRFLEMSLDGVLRYAPIAALHDGDRYLAENFALTIRTSAGSPARPEAGENWHVAGLGTTRGEGDLAPLPAVATELERIVRRGKGDDGILPGHIYLDDAFTAERLWLAAAEGTPVVHLASHFVLRPGRAADSYLLLGDGNHLSLADFAQRDIRFDRVELLTLSACNTAAPAGSDGREIEGLGTLAQRQGASQVLATLWPVADTSTAQFMWRVYQFHADGAPLSRALQRAQVAFLKGRANANRPRLAPYRHPFYWAPFVLMANRP